MMDRFSMPEDPTARPGSRASATVVPAVAMEKGARAPAETDLPRGVWATGRIRIAPPSLEATCSIASAMTPRVESEAELSPRMETVLHVVEVQALLGIRGERPMAEPFETCVPASRSQPATAVIGTSTIPITMASTTAGIATTASIRGGGIRASTATITGAAITRSGTDSTSR